MADEMVEGNKTSPALRISVIIPTYGRNAPLVRSIRMWLEQSRPADDLVVVDQRPNHDAATVAFLQQEHRHIRYVVSETPNLPAARNLGIRSTTADVIVFCDDDILPPPDTLSLLEQTFRDPAVEAVTGFIVFKILATGEILSISHQPLHHARHRSRLLRLNDFIGGFMAFRSGVFARTGGFDEWMGAQRAAAGEDFEFSLRLRKHRIRLWLDPRLELVHESRLEGGCAKTEIETEERNELASRMAFYSYLKNPPAPGMLGRLIAIYRCYRAAILNRSVLHLGLRRHWRQHARFFRLLHFAQEALARANERLDAATEQSA